MTRRCRVSAVVAGALSVCALAAVTACQPADRSAGSFGWVDPPSLVLEATVTRVVDGNTVEVETADGVFYRVRVIGIDTPETVEPNTPVQCWGPEASVFARELLDGQRVTIRDDPRTGPVDEYGRLLQYLTLPDGRDYSTAAADAGAARAYVFDSASPPQLAPEIAAAEDRARTARVGLWGPPCNGDT